MILVQLRFLCSMLLLAGSLIASAGAQAQTNTLSVTLGVVNLPSTITLCRDPTAISAYGVDAEWYVGINVDNKVNTGEPSSGDDVLLLVESTPQSSGCSPVPNQNTQQNLIAGVLVWDSSQQTFIDSGAAASVVANSVTSTLEISTDISGALADLTPQSPMSAAAGAVYTPTGSMPTNAYDNTSVFALGSFTTDNPGDVLQCTAPCSQTASWIKMIDLINVAATSSSALPAFGENTVYVEFDVATMPSTLNLCRYPSQFTSGAGFVDSQWLALFDLDSNTNTPPGSGGAEALIFAATPPQNQNCAPHSVATNQAVFYADLETWDGTQGTYVHVADLPVTVNSATGKIVVQADRTSTALAGLSASSHIFEQAAGLYDSADPNNRFAYDIGGPIGLGGSYTAASGNVQNCSGNCSPMLNWYSQIDLVGGSVQLPNEIFRDTFE